ncbi:hypothetical protein HANVADRAFT_52229 [Hanseniaspora valbyensis NRRL Y-1626]|uniref:Vacuolar protein sorting-associated protein 54 C-terminal domain-containing protein n=1 Tax=Hanseniaspora valbyensis NRRL Y-1626 TaxID=766949 RepID=A0A1B7TFF8_9ASCO|nr:hypothetical protein HANVADRAFT_52229 [Hanseniaspora valbyensis NRRL Y-1626]
MNLNSPSIEGSGLLQAPHITGNEMISFRKSVDQRPSRSVLNSPNPHTPSVHPTVSNLVSPVSSNKNSMNGMSAVDKYTPINTSESTTNLNNINTINNNNNIINTNNGVSFFDSDDSGVTYPNSVYETIMNTQNRDWFQRPATYEVPNVKLIHGENMDFMKGDNWRRELKGYLSVITPIFQEYMELNALENDFMDNGEVGDDHDDIPAIFQQSDFNLEQNYYMQQVNALIEEGKDNKVLLTKLKLFLRKIDGLFKGVILENKDKFVGMADELQNIEQNLLKFEELVKSKIEANKNLLETEMVKNEALINMELRLKNVCKLEKHLLEIDSMINKITKLCDEYHLESETNSDTILLPFDSLKNYMTKIGLLETELNKNNLFTDIKLLADKKNILLNLKLEIGGKLLLQFVKLLEDDLENYSKNNFSNDHNILLIMNAESNWPDLKFDNYFKLLLKEYIENLSSNDSLINAYQMYCEKIINKCRDLVKQNLPKPNENETVVLKMSQLIRNMTPIDFSNLVEFVFSKSLIYFKRLYEQQKLLLDLGINALDSSKLDANIFLKLDIRSGINESIRIIQLRMSKIINCRSDLHARLNYDSFLKLRLNMCNFSRQCEQLTGEILTLNLNDVIVVHTDEYQKLLSERLNKKLKTFIEQKEEWLPVIVDGKIQKYVNDIFLSNDIIPSSWIISPVDDENSTESQSNSANINKKSIIVNDKTFVASQTLVEVIKIVREIMIVTYNLPIKYCQNLENGLITILADFDKFSLANLISNPSILNTYLANNNSIVPLNNNGNINVNSIIFKNKEKNYTVLAEAIECLKELIPLIQQFFNNRDKQNHKIVKTANIISHRTTRVGVSKLYDHLLTNYENSAGLIYKCNIPPPSESSTRQVSMPRRSLDKEASIKIVPSTSEKKVDKVNVVDANSGAEIKDETVFENKPKEEEKVLKEIVEKEGNLEVKDKEPKEKIGGKEYEVPDAKNEKNIVFEEKIEKEENLKKEDAYPEDKVVVPEDKVEEELKEVVVVMGEEKVEEEKGTLPDEKIEKETVGSQENSNNKTEKVDVVVEVCEPIQETEPNLKESKLEDYKIQTDGEQSVEPIIESSQEPENVVDNTATESEEMSEVEKDDQDTKNASPEPQEKTNIATKTHNNSNKNKKKKKKNGKR